MMGLQRNDQAQFFDSLHLDERVPASHLLRRIDVFATWALADIHREIATFYDPARFSGGLARSSRQPQ
jgi:hypothetical protein